MTATGTSAEHSQNPRPGGTWSLAGHEVARVGYGAMQLPHLDDPADARSVIRRARDLGVDHVDTALFYGHGFSNECLAAELGSDEGVVVVTKVGARPSKRGPVPLASAQRPEELREGVVENLRTLRRERLDVVNLRHIPRFGFPKGPRQHVKIEDQLAEMVAMREEGLIGAIGLSTVTAEQLTQSLPAGIVCVQNAYSLVSRGDEDVLDICRAEGIAWVPYFPLGGTYPGSPKVRKNAVARQIADELGTTPAQVGLAWLLQHAENTMLIPGTSSIDHLEQNVAVGDLELSEDQMARLDAI